MKKVGHEIGSHTMTHPVLTRVTLNEAIRQIETSKAELVKRNLATTAVHFAAPESDTDDNTDKYIAKYYASHRNTFGDIENGVGPEDVNTATTSFDRYNIIGYSVRQSTTLAHIQEALQYAKATNGWLVLVYHQIDDSASEYAVSSRILEQQLQTIKQSGIKSATMGQVLANSKVKES